MDIIGKDFERTFQIEQIRGDDDQVKTYRASLSSELPVRRFFGTEILVHDDESVNMERATRGLSILFNHDVDTPIGRVGNIRLEKSRLVGDMVFSPNSDRAKQIKAEIDDGFLSDVSIRYSIDDYDIVERKEHDEYRITKWTPLEASIVTVPADHSVGVGRSKTTEGQNMTDMTTTGGAGTSGGGNVVQMAQNEGAVKERERILAINTLFEGVGFQGAEFAALRAKMIEAGSPIEHAQRELLKLIGTIPSDQAPVNPVHTQRQDPTPSATAGADEIDKFVEGASRSLEFRVGLLDDRKAAEEMRSNDFAGFTLVEFAREWCRRAGINVAGASRDAIIGYAFRPDMAPGGRRDLIGHGTSAFTNILANTANKSLLRGWTETDETWQQWTRITDLPDYKVADRPGLSEFNSLDLVKESGEYKHGTISDRKETIQAAKYGKLFAITREAMINDDASAFGVIPRKMGRAGSRKIGDIAYAILTANAALNQDSTALFHADHSNLGTAGAPSVTTLDEIVQLMALQTDSASAAHGLNIRPKFIIVPVALATKLNILLAAQNDPIGNAGAKGGGVQPNPFQMAFTPISDPRLDADSSSQWYAAADPYQHDTVEVGFVGGRREPQLESRDGWSIDGIEWKVRVEAAAAALDFRGLARNAG